MNDDAIQKLITNPQKIVHILPVKWNARSDAGVADETIPDALGFASLAQFRLLASNQFLPRTQAAPASSPFSS